jgi:glycosyltransferase involved in cell wall biosynthesis
VSLDLKSTLDYAIPTKLLTYLCHGLPVFGTGGIATKTITREANAGVITTKYNLHEDTDNLLRLLKDPEKLENYSKNAVLFAKKNLSLESCSKKAQKIYKFHLQ